MRFGSLFSGIGGFDLAFERAGMVAAWQCDNDAPCRRVLERHFPDTEVYDDVRAITATAAPVQLICGGFPCQDLSVAGRREGLAGERSGLWFEFHRILGVTRPEWCVIENVPGLLSSNGGRDFAVILRGLVELGYGVTWRILDAQYCGLAQRRKRVFIVGSLGDGRSAQVLFEPESVSGHPPPRAATRQGVAPTITGRARKGGGQYPGGTDFDIGGGLIAEVGAPLAASHSGYRNDADTTDNLVAHAVTTHVVKGGDPTTDNYVVAGWDPVNVTSRANPSPIRPGITPTLHEHGMSVMAFGWNKSESQTMRCDALPDALQASPTSNPAIAFNTKQSLSDATSDTVTGTLKTGGDKGKSGGTLGIASPSGVRRLTPTECERLQGFPDGWTAGQSDSTRYRQLGNAVAVPVALWIATRITRATAP